MLCRLRVLEPFDNKGEEGVKRGYVGIHSSGFKDFLLKPELLRALSDCGFEHPSEGTDRTRMHAIMETNTARHVVNIHVQTV